jgi:hypothetical protein
LVPGLLSIENEARKKKNLIPSTSKRIKTEYYDRKNTIKEISELEDEEDEKKVEPKKTDLRNKVLERNKKFNRLRKFENFMALMNAEVNNFLLFSLY